MTSLNLTFDGHEVFYLKKEGIDYIYCKGVFFDFRNYKKWIDNPSKKVLGYNKEGQECTICIIKNTVRIGCLTETLEKFNNIIISAKKIIKNGNK